jgi:hypothetical protein
MERVFVKLEINLLCGQVRVAPSVVVATLLKNQEPTKSVDPQIPAHDERVLAKSSKLLLDVGRQ